MPRSGGSQAASAFSQVQKQAREILSTLRREIRSTEAELDRLKREESQLARLLGERSESPRGRGSNGAGRAGTRTNWGEVLEQMPKQFKASDVRGVRGARDKRSSEIFAAITRWMEAGLVKKKERGLYERAK